MRRRATARRTGGAIVNARQQTVRRLWAAYQARDWAAAREQLAPQLRCTWWSSGERFDGAEAVVHVNAVYPEGWRITVLAVEALADGGVLSLVRVDHGDACHHAHSWFRFAAVEAAAGERIAAIDEYWAEVLPPPAWRDGLPGRSRLPADTRPTV